MTALELQRWGNGSDELDEFGIEQRHPRFQSVRHRHAIFNLQERWQQVIEVEPGHELEVNLTAAVLRSIEEFLKTLKDPGAVQQSPIDLVLHVAGSIDQSEVAAVERAEHSLGQEMLQKRFIFPQHRQILEQRFGDRIGSAVALFDRRVDLLLEVGDRIAGVPSEKLVAALSA